MNDLRRWMILCEALDQAAIDAMYAERYWKSHPGYEERTWENIEPHIKKHGTIPVFVNREGRIDDASKEKLAAYRVLAQQHGYRVGQFTRDPKNLEIVVATAVKS